MKKIVAFTIVSLLIITSFSTISAVKINNVSDDKNQGDIVQDGGIGKDDSSVYKTGLIVSENWWVDAPFDPCEPMGMLPDSFDWREELHSGIPKIKDQGNCGSCWAFATVGPLEWNIARMENKVIDLSEQWLVSCSKYDCGGGYLDAHRYHLYPSDPNSWKDPCGDSGAVLEKDFEYVGYDASCNCPHPHEYYIDDWSYIGSSQSVPSVDSMKQAIMDYGPITAGVCVGPAFVEYDGGIFKTSESCGPYSVNHAIVLVGWDDGGFGEPGHWILRNSWGKEWGEDGYMRIKYGTSKVGYAACYIEYTPDGLYTPGYIDFGTIRPGESVTRTFCLYNGGDRCYWYIPDDSGSEDADWVFTPSSGMIYKGGQQGIKVTVTAKTVDGDVSVYGWLYIKNEDDWKDYSRFPYTFDIEKSRQSPRSMMLELLAEFPILKNFFYNLLQSFYFL